MMYMFKDQIKALNKLHSRISELEAALLKSNDENMELVEKCKKLTKENELLKHTVRELTWQ